MSDDSVSRIYRRSPDRSLADGSEAWLAAPPSSPSLGACTGPKKIFAFREESQWSGKSGKLSFFRPYSVFMEVPEGCYSQAELDRLRRVILKLNPFVGSPIRKFRWEPLVPEDVYSTGSDYWSWPDHSITLSHQPDTGALLPRIDGTEAELIQLMGVALYDQKFFKKEKEWDEVYLRSLGFRNYEILNDRNYLKDSKESVGKPWHDAEAAFASAVYVYFAHADRFAAVIRDEKTPEVTRNFGKMVWTFLRDRAFYGAVFTFNGVDPFRAESFPSALEKLPEKPACLIDLFANDNRSAARQAGAGGLRNAPFREAAPALQIAREDSDPDVAEAARSALRQILPR